MRGAYSGFEIGWHSCGRGDNSYGQGDVRLWNLSNPSDDSNGDGDL